MSWGLDLLKAVAKAIVPEAAKRLLDRALPTKRPPPVAPARLPFKHVQHQQEQIASATSPRAITQRYAIPPPPPSAKRKR